MVRLGVGGRWRGGAGGRRSEKVEEMEEEEEMATERGLDSIGERGEGERGS